MTIQFSAIRVNEAVYDEGNTYSILDAVDNFQFARLPGFDENGHNPEASKKWQDLQARFHAVRYNAKLDSKEIFKEIFGQQQTVVQYSNRNWVWTFTDGNAIMYCLVSVGGVAWEWNKSSDVNAVLPLMEQIVRAVEGKYPEHAHPVPPRRK